MPRFWRSLVAALALAGGLPAAAQAAIVEYDFTGTIQGGFLLYPPLNLYVQSDDPVSGFFRFDSSTAPASPGQWVLPTAEFKAQLGSLSLDIIGATASVSGLADAIRFEAIKS